jgi:Tol biopolymer transport system component
MRAIRRASALSAVLLAIAGCSAGSSPGVTTTPPTTPPAATATATAGASGAVDLCHDTLPAVSAASTNGTPAGSVSNGRILFGIEATQGAGTIALAYLDVSGFHVIPLAQDGTLAHAAWAPDGTVVFDSERAGGRHLFRVATDGSGLTQITKEPGGAEQGVSFSPDGSRIAYEHYSCVEERDFGIQVANADGSNAVALNQPFPLHSTAGESDAAISPDGKTVAFVRFVDDSHGAVWVVPAAGGEAKRLTSDDYGAGYPRWSPDGRSILFDGTNPVGSTRQLFVVATGGGEPRPVFPSDTTLMRWEGDWSPDGTQLTFKAYQSGWHYNELRTAAADGTHEQTIWTGTESTAETPHWGR